MPDEEVLKLSARCDDPNDWTLAQLESVLAIPELRSMVSPTRVARRIVGRLAVAPDAALLSLLAQLQQREDPFMKAIAAALRTPEVGWIIGREIAATDQTSLESLGAYLCAADENVVAAALQGLLLRAVGDDGAFDAMCWLANAYGVPRLRAWLNLGALQGDSAATLGRVMASCNAPANVGLEVIDLLSPPIALAFLKALNPADLTPLVAVVRRQMDRAARPVVEGFADVLLAQPNEL